MGKTRKTQSLRDRMVNRLSVAKFRLMNESSSSALSIGSKDEFESYHRGFKRACSEWKSHPLDWIADRIKKTEDGNSVVADFGCGEARLRTLIPNKTHSFDVYSVNEHVVECDISNVPLEDKSVDVVVICLSLMTQDVTDIVREAWRVLRGNGRLYVAEPKSRVNQAFVREMKRAFKVGKSHHTDVFSVFLFKKLNHNTFIPSRVRLLPSNYKKR